MIFEVEYLPRLADLNFQKQVTYESILTMLEDAGSRHSTAVKNGILSEMDKGRTWIITEWVLQTKRLPVGEEKIKIKTWTYAKEKSFFMNREFLMENEKGEELLRARTQLVLMDMEAKKPIRIAEAELAPYNPEEISFIEDKPRLLPAKEWEETLTLPLRYSDFDYNGHVHNTKYFLLAKEICRLEKFDNLRIVYKNPLKDTKTATIKKHKEDNKTIIGIYDEEILCTLIEGE